MQKPWIDGRRAIAFHVPAQLHLSPPCDGLEDPDRGANWGCQIGLLAPRNDRVLLEQPDMQRFIERPPETPIPTKRFFDGPLGLPNPAGSGFLPLR